MSRLTFALPVLFGLATLPLSGRAEPPQDAAPPTGSCEYWIGIHGRQTPPMLRSHLDLPHDGVAVERVLPGGPADRAGLKPHDLLVTVDGEPIPGPAPLCQAIDESGGEPLKLGVIRGGKRRLIAVTPQPRPTPPRPARTPTRTDPDADRVLKWLRRVQPPHGFVEPELLGRVRLHFIHPGMILPAGAGLIPSLPPDMRVSISKRSDRPARITVERGDRRWEVTEDRLDDLPDHVRPHVDRMLGRLPLATADRPALKVAPPEGKPSSGGSEPAQENRDTPSKEEDGETELFLPAPSVGEIQDE
ncbi:MAG: PDZ domain-containing protein [Pirellulales bacterium]